MENDNEWKQKQIVVAARTNLDDDRIVSFEARIIPKKGSQQLSTQVNSLNDTICETMSSI